MGHTKLSLQCKPNRASSSSPPFSRSHTFSLLHVIHHATPKTQIIPSSPSLARRRELTVNPTQDNRKPNNTMVLDYHPSAVGPSQAVLCCSQKRPCRCICSSLTEYPSLLAGSCEDLWIIFAHLSSPLPHPPSLRGL